MRIIFLISLAVLAACHADARCQYSVHVRHALYGFNSVIHKHTSIDQCMAECDLLEEHCNSFDYSESTSTCFLSDEDKDSQSAAFGPHSNMDYYGKVSCGNGDDDGDDDDGGGSSDGGDDDNDSEEESGAGNSECRDDQLGREYMGHVSATVSGRECQQWTSQYPHDHSQAGRPFPDGSMSAAENYCRNPDNEPGGPWCYTTDHDVRWEYCPVQSCEESCYTGSTCDYNPCEGATCGPYAEARCSLVHCGGCRIQWMVGANVVDCEGPPPPYNDACRDTVRGREYLGSHAVTRSGINCQSWSAQYPHEHKFKDPHPVFQAGDGSVDEAYNYCRNPDNEPEGPWCYTTDSSVRWDYCDVPFCYEMTEECRDDQLGREYTGQMSTTVSGRDCQQWTSQYPHGHSQAGRPFPDGSMSAAENYCRNPDNEQGGPWCYTTDPEVTWEYCPVQSCKESCYTDSTCDYNPCEGATCGPYAEARCSLVHCGGCRVQWMVGADVVDCEGPPPPYNDACRDTVRGREYLGSHAVTRSGINCQSWSAQYPHAHKFKDPHPVFQAGDGSVDEAYNYCRNPDNEPEGPWCYTTDSSVRWDYCDVPFCYEMTEECRDDQLGREYTGQMSTTVSGRDCQQWTSQYPHGHSQAGRPFPDGSMSAAENYCRNPDSEPEGPWCYTTDSEVRWEYCDVPFC